MSFDLVEKPVGTQDLLVYLWRHGRTAVLAVLQDTGMSKETFYRAVDRLKSLGYLYDEEQVGFPTHKYLCLTRAGETLAKALAPVSDLLAATSRALAAELERLEQIGDPESAHRRMELLEAIVDREFSAGRWEAAQRMAERLVMIAREGRAIRSEALGHIVLGRIFQKRDAHDDAMRELESGLGLARAADDQGSISDADYLIGSDLERRGRWGEAADRFSAAADAAVRAQDPVRSARARLGTGRLMGRQGKLEDSLRLLQDVVKDLEAAGNEDELPRAYASVGATVANLGRPEAIAWFEKAAEAARRNGDVLMEAHAIANAAAHWIDARQYKKAEQQLGRARSTFEELQDRSGLTGVELNLANLYRDEHRWKDAEDHYDLAHSLAQGTGNRFQEAYALFNRGLMMKRRDRMGEARALILDARGIFATLGNAPRVARCDEELGAFTEPGTK